LGQAIVRGEQTSPSDSPLEKREKSLPLFRAFQPIKRVKRKGEYVNKCRNPFRFSGHFS